MSEWSIVLPWKGSVELNQPWVRIPPSPPFSNILICKQVAKLQIFNYFGKSRIIIIINHFKNMYKTVSKNMQTHISEIKLKRGSLEEFKIEEEQLLTELKTLVDNKKTNEDERKIYILYNELINLLNLRNEKYPIKESHKKYIIDLINEYRITPIIKKIEKEKKK